MKIVLLPGLDGTGDLFEPILNELPKNIDVTVIKYNNSKKQTYKELVEYVATQLPKDDFILVAESFSGYIAYKIGLKRFKNLKHIVFVATFLTNPRAIMLNLIPSFIFRLRIPKLIIKWLFLGFNTDKNIINLFQKTINNVASDIIKFRLQEIKKLKPTNNKLNLPTTYIQATQDYLVPTESLKDFQKLCQNLKVYQIRGKHLIVQSNPKDCAKIINSLNA